METEQQISIGQVLSTLRRHIGLIAASTVIVTLLSVLVTFFIMTPKYSATTEILVNRKLPAEMQGAQFQQVQADVQMISTYKDIIMSPAVLRDVDSSLAGQAGYPGENGMKKAISISSQQNSQVFSITAKSTNPEMAAKIANKTASVFKNKIGKIMSVNNVSMVSKAQADDQPVSPRTKLNLVAGLILGLLIGFGLAFLRELSDRTVTSEEFLTDELGLNSLGVVNEIAVKDLKKRVVPNNSDDAKSHDSKDTSRTRRRV
ncbi:YveK family protein [Pediococcus claussenii]|uniref:Capsular polysaccharide biosynthesis protein CpsC n=1 Tax=Pediococcus claussenii (strain ATCC BAA-344 / DSM 14800 / JCM 18046 / KCTC 3811 / LMG 21948 / P06) TaxID=701521 RepID=G8PE07_PEDCP|nr:Wzz/FepE/Etk N-terminal domain-containing protein [Pediococcus claussenii]AEV95492.1 Tyrosine-protein kinase transmembrane modulator [Pediococcus claussenii ATCC BAA-344]ANZ69016.1 chain-length determining protein [Pediococcus claussenii]ANZ70832.1 chain-length determining protein [Pediococcus claussenii]KRN20273.1 ywqC protein [Pediococcus claussenii]